MGTATERQCYVGEGDSATSQGCDSVVTNPQGTVMCFIVKAVEMTDRNCMTPLRLRGTIPQTILLCQKKMEAPVGPLLIQKILATPPSAFAPGIIATRILRLPEVMQQQQHHHQQQQQQVMQAS